MGDQPPAAPAVGSHRALVAIDEAGVVRNDLLLVEGLSATTIGQALTLEARVSFLIPAPGAPFLKTRADVWALPAYRSKWSLLRHPILLGRLVGRTWRAVGQADLIVSVLPSGAAIMAYLIATARRRARLVLITGDLLARVAVDRKGPRLVLAWALGGVYRVFERWAVGRQPTLVSPYPVADRYRSVRSVVFAPLSSVSSSDIFDRPQVSANRPLSVLFVGRLERLKGVDCILRSLDHLARFRFRLEMIGDGPLREECDRVAAGDPRVVVRGLLPHTAVLEAFARSDVVLVPSLIEGLPRTILEAWAKGCAVIASDIPPLRALCGSGGGLLVPADDPAALALAIRALAREPQARARIVARGRERLEGMTRERSEAAIIAGARQALARAPMRPGSEVSRDGPRSGSRGQAG